MTAYRLGPNGFFNDQVSDTEMATIFKNLAALRRDSLVDFNMILKGYVPVEIIRLVRRLTGDTFSQWMRANADGPLAGLVRDLLNYLNGKIGHLTINTSISIHEERMKNTSHFHDAQYVPSNPSGGSALDPLIKGGLDLYDFDLYRLISGMGPIAVARIFLLHGGESYYA